MEEKNKKEHCVKFCSWSKTTAECTICEEAYHRGYNDAIKKRPHLWALIKIAYEKGKHDGRLIPIFNGEKE